MATKIKLAGVRIRFPKLFEAEQFDGQGDYRFSADFLIEKGSALEKQIEAAVQEEAAATWGKGSDKTLANLRDNNQKCAWQDGDKTKYDSDDGNMLLCAKRKEKDGRPLVFDRDKTPLVKDTGRIYSGAYVNATVEVWAQKGQYQGIRCTLLGVQFYKDGDNFGGASKGKEDDFEELGVEDGEDALV